MGKKYKKTKVTGFKKFRNKVVATVKAVTMREWFIIIWTVAKDIIDIVKSLPLRDFMILLMTIALEFYNWFSNISDFIYGITHGILSFVICIAGVFLAFPYVDRTIRFLSAPSLFFGLYLVGHFNSDPIGSWLQGAAIGSAIAWFMTEIKLFLDDIS